MYTARFTHHQTAIEHATEHFRQQPDVIAVFLGGSLAKGFAQEDSDIDLIIVLTESGLRARHQSGERHFFSTELADYDGGYVEGKYVDVNALHQVIDNGNQPTRYAYHKAVPLFCHDDNVLRLVQKAAEFPKYRQAHHRERFYAMILAWHWYCHQGLRQDNPFLIQYAVSQLTLFAARLVLNENARLYPYLKWMTAELDQCQDAPLGMGDLMDDCLSSPTAENINSLLSTIQVWGRHRLPAAMERRWPEVFMEEIETPWMIQTPHITDL